MVFKIWITDIIKGRQLCLRRGIPSIDRRYRSHQMHQFLHNRIMVLLNLITQNKEEVNRHLSKMKSRSTVGTNKWVYLQNARCRAIDHQNSTTSQASRVSERTLRSSKSVTDNRISFRRTVTPILPPPSACTACANNQTPVVT